MKHSLITKISTFVLVLLWSITSTLFAQISEMEYFFDTDPGFGNATPLNTGFTPSDSINLNVTIPINSNFSPGVHQLYIRAKNGNKWGHTSRQLFFSAGIYSNNNDLVAAEFYFDTDPGFGSGTPLTISAGDSLNTQKLIPVPSNLTGGIHSLYIRVKNSNQVWSHSSSQLFLVSGLANSAGQVSAMEYYFDQDPGVGSATPLSFNANDTVQQLFTIPVSTLSPGFHTLYIRAKNDNNIWGIQEARQFMVTNNVPGVAKIAGAEYFIDADPGFGMATPIAINPAVDSFSNNQVIALPNNLTEGGHTLAIRVKDEQQNWSLFETQDFVVKYPKPGSGFALSFDGSNDKVEVPVDALGAEYTVTAWVKSNQENATNQSIISFSSGNPITSNSHQIRINGSGKIENYIYDGTQQQVSSTIALGTSKWYHIAITGKNNGQMKLYVNGMLEGTPQNVGTMWNAMTTMHIGQSSASGFNYFKGNVDEVTLWKVELTEAQIRDRMCRKIDSSDNLSAQLSNYFNFDENTGTKVFDVDRQKVGYINGASWVSSGAAIGNKSKYNYSGANSSVSLTHPTRADSVMVALNVPGNAQGVQLYCVTDSANTINGTTCLSENAGYFGVFPIGGSNVTYALDYDYTPFVGGSLNEGGFKLYKRKQNNTAAWSDSYAGIDSVQNLLTPLDTLRGEYMVSSAVVLPLISISSNKGDSVCLGTLVQFTATASNQGDTPTFEWRKNGVVVGNNSNTYSDSTLIDQSVITCKLTSNSNCVSPDTAISNSILMKVGSFPASVLISASPNNQICAGVTVNFTATPSHGGTNPSYQWALNGINIGGNANVLTLNTLNDGDSVSCVMLTAEACAFPDSAFSNGIIMDVTPTFVPTVTMAANMGTTICSGTSVTFTATPNSSSSTPNYQWKKNGTNVGVNSPTYTDNTLNNGDIVYCRMTSTEACSFPVNVNSDTLTFNVSSSASTSVAISSNLGTTICEQAQVTFTATATNQGVTPTFQWKKNGLNVGIDSSKYVDANLNMNDEVSCFLTSSSSCAAPDSATSNVLTIITQPYLTPTIAISASGADTICSGTNIVFTAATTQTGGNSNFQWLNNGVAISGANGATYSSIALTNADTISCKLTSNYPCLSINNVISDSIYKVILAVPVAYAGVDQTINQGSSTVLTASGGDTYLWSTGDTAASIVVSPSATTTYTVAAYNQSGCSSSDNVKITVNYSSLAVAPSSVNFGNIVLNNTVNSFVTVTNNGTLPDTVHSASISGAFGTSFTSTVLAPSQSVQIPISFLPTNTIFYQEPLLVQTSAGNFTVIVKGKGQLPAAAWTISQINYSFGNVAVGDSMIHAFSVQNTGNIPIVIDTAISNNSLFELWTSSATIPVNAASIVYAKFKPVTIGSFSAQASISSVNTSLSDLTLSLSGLGYVAGAKPILSYNSSFPYSGNSGIDHPVSPPGTFTYSVVYKHPNGTAPQAGFPKVGIDQNADQDFLDTGEGMFTMSKIGNGTDWMNGETYVFSYQLPLGTGFGYQFFAKDSLGNVASSTAVQYVSGPLITNQSVDLNIYANDITFSDNTPSVGQVFTVFAQVRNNSPYPASNVPIRFYNDSVFLAADTIPNIPANSTLTINRNLSFNVDGFYPIKVWIDSSQTLGETNVLNNYAIRPVIVGNFSMPGAITTTSNAITSSCNIPSVGISGRATYSGLNLANNPPVLGATVTVSILNGPSFTTHTVTDGNWNVNWTDFSCGQHFDYTVEITDYTLTSALLSDTFLAPCIPCYTPSNPITFSHGGSIPKCVPKLTPTAYTINLASSCNAPSYYNDSTFVYLDNVLLNTHVRDSIAPCITVFDTDFVNLNVGSYVLSYKHVFYDSAGVRTVLSGSNSIIVGDLPEIYTSSFTKTSSTSFSFRNSNSSYCVPAGSHTVFLYDSTTISGQYILLDSFNVSNISPAVSLSPYVSLSYANPGMEMGNHYLRIVTDVHNEVSETNEANNVFETIFYVPYPELSVTEIELSNSNIQEGTVVNFTAKIHNTGSGSDTFKVQFYANGIAFGSPIQIDTMVANSTQQIISPTYTIPADTCPIVITAYVDSEQAIQELNKINNKDSMYIAYDLQSGVACFGYGSACSPYVVVRDSIVHFQSVVTNTGTRDINQNVDVTFKVYGITIGYDNIGGGIASETQKPTGVYHSFGAVGSYQIVLHPDSANVICELNEANNMGVIYVNVVEGMPDLEIFSEHISPSNLNPMPNQTINVVASVFNKGNQSSVPSVVRFWVDSVQLGSDIPLSALAAGTDTTVAANAIYSSPLVGPKIIKVSVDATNVVQEMNESNNSATRAIIVGAAPDFARTINAGISISNLLPRLEDTILISSAIRNFGGASGTGIMKFYIKNSAAVSTLIDSATFSLGSNDSITISKNWIVDFIGNGTIYTEIEGANPQEFNVLNNKESLNITTGPRLRIVDLSTNDSVLCLTDSLSLVANVLNDGQALTFDWKQNGNILTGATDSTFVNTSVNSTSAGQYNFTVSDNFGSLSSRMLSIVVNNPINILSQPAATLQVCEGNVIELELLAQNATAYQWQFETTPILGADSTSLRVDYVLANQSGNYSVLMQGQPGCDALLSNVSAVSVNVMNVQLADSGTVDSFYHYDSLTYNYSDDNCMRLASVISGNNNLGLTFVSTMVDSSLLGYVPRYVDIHPQYNLPATVVLYYTQQEFDKYNEWAILNNKPLLPTSASDTNINKIVIEQYHGLPSSGTTGPNGIYDSTNMELIPNALITVEWVASSNFWKLTLPVTSFSGFFVKSAPISTTLNIDLVNFGARNQGAVNLINWQTLREDRMGSFELERSGDGKNFEILSSINAQGKPSFYLEYDSFSLSGANYYRLKMNNMDGQSHYSKTVKVMVNVDQKRMLNAFPNPTKEIVFVEIGTTITADAILQLMDVTGKEIRTFELKTQSFKIDFSNFISGVYLLKYTSNGKTETIKLIKE
ncbi:MAG TPA: CARDB domain-containing protein [Edaphocola sp.]|nr:CARDB domain-containing protein [Edaphocola sp.]